MVLHGPQLVREIYLVVCTKITSLTLEQWYNDIYIYIIIYIYMYIDSPFDESMYAELPSTKEPSSLEKRM